MNIEEFNEKYRKMCESQKCYIDNLQELYNKYRESEENLAKYFGLEQIPRLCNVGEINDDYWFIDEFGCLNFSETIEGFETGNCYCLDGGCDQDICGRYEKGNYIALVVGCGEHYDGKFEIFRKDREIPDPR